MPRFAGQPDLFARPEAGKPEPMEQEFIDGIRQELLATLTLARGAAVLPWRDLTRTTLAELRFNSIAGWLPDAEAARLRAAFAIEMQRLYAAAEGVPERLPAE